MNWHVERALILAHRARQALINVHWTPPGIRAQVNPARADPVERARLFAVLGTYNEADIVEATVANALAQGVERVYLVDNASTDDTVQRARAAGAELAETFATPHFQESVRILLMNHLVWRISSPEPAEHIWWLWLDADEFPHGPSGTTIRQYLEGLDRRFRLVGADYYNHFPSGQPEYRRGFHPIEFQPLCQPHHGQAMPRCSLHHFKHPLQRYDRDGAFILSSAGFHTAQANDRATLLEPTTGIVTHHFQYREEAATRRRLAEVYEVPGRGEQAWRANWRTGHQRLASIDAVYQQRWSEVDNQRRVRGTVGVAPRPWSEYSDGPGFARWYSADDLTAAVAVPGSGADADAALDVDADDPGARPPGGPSLPSNEPRPFGA